MGDRTLEEVELAFLIQVGGGRGDQWGILAVWRDGFLVWSADPIRGGPPYRVGQQPPEVIEEAWEQVLKLAEIGTLPARQFFFGPGARWLGIVIFERRQPIVQLGSWHELFEASPDLVVTQTGIEPLSGRDREAVLAAQSPDYLAFRRRWQRMKERLLALVSVHGVPYDAQIHRTLPW
jgi:hypothetical protein